MSTPRIEFTPRVIAGSILVLIPFLTFVIGMSLPAFLGEKYHTARRVDALDWDAGPSPTVAVDLFEGYITVAQATDGRVSARLTRFAVTKESQAAADAALDGIALAATREGDAIRIKTTTTRTRGKLSQWKADIELRVPPDAAVDLTTGHGSIFLGKVYEGAYGANLATTPVALRAARAVDQGETDTGIDAVLAPRPSLPPTQLDLASRHGSVTIRGENLRVDARADGGAIQFAGRPAAGIHHLRTGKYVPHVAEPGQLQRGIRLTLPADCGFEVDAQAPGGGVSNEFAGIAGQAAAPGPAGAAAAIRLELRAEDGPIEIRKARARAQPSSATTPPTTGAVEPGRSHPAGGDGRASADPEGRE